MLIRIDRQAFPADVILPQTASYLDVADALLEAGGHFYYPGTGRLGAAATLSPALPEDFAGIDIDAFLDRVSTLATQI